MHAAFRKPPSTWSPRCRRCSHSQPGPQGRHGAGRTSTGDPGRPVSSSRAPNRTRNPVTAHDPRIKREEIKVSKTRRTVACVGCWVTQLSRVDPSVSSQVEPPEVKTSKAAHEHLQAQASRVPHSCPQHIARTACFSARTPHHARIVAIWLSELRSRLRGRSP